MLVTDLSRDVAGGFCTRLLALGGADVVSFPDRRQTAADSGGSHTGVEQDESQRGRLAFGVDWLGAYLGSHKWEVDGGSSEDEDRSLLHELVGASDVVVTSFDSGRYLGPIDADGVRNLNPRAVHVTTSSFGTTGPYATWRGGSLADWAAGGYLYITGEPTREPLCGPENLCAYVGGYTAAIAVQAGSLLAQRSGEGVHIDVSVMAAMVSVHQSTFSRLGIGVLRTRTGRYTEVYPLAVLPCRDGYVSLGVVVDDEFDRLTIAMGQPEIVGDPRFATPGARIKHRDDLDALLVPWLAGLDAADVVAKLQSVGIPSAKVATTTELLASPQLADRGFWEEVTVGGAVGRMPGNPVPAPGPARPAIGGQLPHDAVRSIITAHRRPPRPVSIGAGGPGLALGGNSPILVLDLTAYWAGPSATRNLADLGARVVRVERPGSRVDYADDSDQGALIGQLFDRKMNRGKESVVLDLGTEAGEDVLRALAVRADVLVENYRAGVMDRFDLGYEALAELNPGLIYISLSGFGNSGPWSPWRSYGPTIEAASSIESRTGYAGGEPLRLGHTLPDGVGGLKGCHYDISQLEAYCAMSGEGLLESSVRGRDLAPQGNAGTRAAPHGVYPCRGDDQWVALAVATNEEWSRFVTVVTAGGLDADEYLSASWRLGHQDDLDRAIARWTASVDKFELAVALQAQGIEAFPVVTADDLVADPQLERRGYFVEVPLGGGKVRLPGSPLYATPAVTRTDGRPPAFGEHTSAVLQTLAGYSADEVAQLGRDKVVALG